MGRRTRLKENTQKAKHLKRPRSWHRKSKKTVAELWLEIKRLKKKRVAGLVEDDKRGKFEG